MTFYNRNGMLYARINGRRVSTKLEDTKPNRKLFESYAKNDEFFKKYNVNKNVTRFVDLCEEVLEKKAKTLKPTSMRAYNSLLSSRIIPYFDKKLVNEIEPLDIYSFYESFEDGSTLNTCNAILKDAFQLAIIRKDIKQTPLVINRPKFDYDIEPNPFTLEEVKAILSELKGWMRNIFGIAVFTGMRPGEIAGQHWDEINFDSMRIEVNRTITLGYTQSPKTKSSKRVIDLPVEALPFFEAQKLLTKLKNKHVFYSPTGKTINCSSMLSYYLNPILEELKIKKRSFYQTRHTFASIRLSMGEKLEWVSWMMGHKNTSITQQKYFKYIPAVDRKRVVIDMNKTQNRHTS